MSESQTPGTDRAKFKILSDLQSGTRDVVSAEVCEEIESELNATRARLAELEGIAERLGRAVDVSLKSMETAYERSSGMLRGFMGGKIDEVKAILAYKEEKK